MKLNEYCKEPLGRLLSIRRITKNSSIPQCWFALEVNLAFTLFAITKENTLDNVVCGKINGKFKVELCDNNKCFNVYILLNSTKLTQ